MSAMPIFKGKRGQCWEHKQRNLFGSFRLWHSHTVVSGAGKSGTEHTFSVHTWNEDGRTSDNVTETQKDIRIQMRHAKTFIYLIFDQFILIKSSFIRMSSRAKFYSSTWHFVSIKFYFNFFSLWYFFPAARLCRSVCEWVRTHVESRRNDDSNDVDDDYTEQTEHFHFARRHLLSVCSDSHSIIIIIIWNRFVLSYYIIRQQQKKRQKKSWRKIQQ